MDQTLLGGGRRPESLLCPCCFFQASNLSCSCHLSPAIRCSAVTPSQETRGQTDAGFLLSGPLPLFRLRKQEMTKDGEREGGADDSQLRGERGGEVGKVSGGERNGGRWRKTGRAVTKL